MRIDIEMTARAKRAIAWFLLPLVVLVGTIAVAHAVGMNPIDTSWIPTAAQNHAGISSSLLKANLDDLQGQLTALQAQITKPVMSVGGGGAGKEYSLAAIPCGQTLPTTPAQRSMGYPGVKQLCETECQMSPSAHVCTLEEMQRSASLGVQEKVTGTGWINGAIAPNTASSAGPGSMIDCKGWSDGTASYSGSAFAVCTGMAGCAPQPYLDGCDSALPFFCCD